MAISGVLSPLLISHSEHFGFLLFTSQRSSLLLPFSSLKWRQTIRHIDQESCSYTCACLQPGLRYMHKHEKRGDFGQDFLFSSYGRSWLCILLMWYHVKSTTWLGASWSQVDRGSLLICSAQWWSQVLHEHLVFILILDIFGLLLSQYWDSTSGLVYILRLCGCCRAAESKWLTSPSCSFKKLVSSLNLQI